MYNFDPNELIIEKVRSVEEFDPSTRLLKGRYTQIEDPAFKFTSETQAVNDAEGVEITKFYKSQKAQFSFSNSLFSLDLLTSQFGTKDGSDGRVIATDAKPIEVPYSETIKVTGVDSVPLTYKPVGTTGAEVGWVYILDEEGSRTTIYKQGTTVSMSATSDGADGVFTLDVTNKKITLPAKVNGSVTVYVEYAFSSADAVFVAKTTGQTPAVRELHIPIRFHKICDPNVVYYGVLVAPRAQIDSSSIDISLKPDGKHAVTYDLQKEYCSDEGLLVKLFVVGEAAA